MTLHYITLRFTTSHHTTDNTNTQCRAQNDTAKHLQASIEQEQMKLHEMHTQADAQKSKNKERRRGLTGVCGVYWCMWCSVCSVYACGVV
jgi:hypothetical protein